MKRTLLTSLAFICAVLGLNAQNLTVCGTIKGLSDGTTIGIAPSSHDNDKAIASADIKDGKFTIKTDINEPMLARILINGNISLLQFMIDKGDNISINAEDCQQKNGNGIYYVIDKATITGSSLNDQYLKFNSVTDTLNQLHADFEKRYESLYKKLSDHQRGSDEYKAIRATDEYKAMSADEIKFFDTVKTKYDNIFRANKDTFWGPLLIIHFMNYLTENDKPLYDSMSEAAKNSFYGRKMYDEMFPAGGVGSEVQDFSITDEAGKTYTLKELLKGKKYVLIDFWASWCAPCRKELPNVKKNYAAYKDKGFDVVSISIDKDNAAWKKAVKEEQLVWPNFRSIEVADKFKVRSVPTIYLLDSNGKIVEMNEGVRGDNLAKKLAELL